MKHIIPEHFGNESVMIYIHSARLCGMGLLYIVNIVWQYANGCINIFTLVLAWALWRIFKIMFFLLFRDQRECPAPAGWAAPHSFSGKSECCVQTTPRLLSWPYRSGGARPSPCTETRSWWTCLQEWTTFPSQEPPTTHVWSHRSVPCLCCILLTQRLCVCTGCTVLKRKNQIQLFWLVLQFVGQNFSAVPQYFRYLYIFSFDQLLFLLQFGYRTS